MIYNSAPFMYGYIICSLLHTQKTRLFSGCDFIPPPQKYSSDNIWVKNLLRPQSDGFDISIVQVKPLAIYSLTGEALVIPSLR